MTYEALDDSDEWEHDEDSWEDHDDSTETIACPACNAEIFEDSIRCSECGEYITHATSTWSGKSTKVWVVVIIVLLIAGLLWPTIVGLLKMLQG